MSIEQARGMATRLRPGPGGLPRGQVTEIQRARMLSAALQTVEEVGYARMTVAQVIGRAKVSRKTFYDVFGNREDCFLEAFEYVILRARTAVMQAAERESGWREQIRAGLAALLEFMDAEPGLAKLCVVDALGAGDRALRSRAEVLDELAAAVDRGRALGSTENGPPEVTAEGVVGAVFAVLHTRLLDGGGDGGEPLSDLLGPLMSVIVLPYLGARAAGRELSMPAPTRRGHVPAPSPGPGRDPLEGLDMRLTYRTVRVLAVIGAHPGASNREIAEASGIADQGQISKLLMRLRRLALVDKRGGGPSKGSANAWYLTERGAEVERAARPR